MTIFSRKALLAFLPLLVSLMAFTMIGPVRAQSPTPVPVHKNWVQRHPTATAVGAGVVTHHMLKKRAAWKKAHGQRLNWAERHPTLSAIGVGAVTHHEIVKHTSK